MALQRLFDQIYYDTLEEFGDIPQEQVTRSLPCGVESLRSNDCFQPLSYQKAVPRGFSTYSPTVDSLQEEANACTASSVQHKPDEILVLEDILSASYQTPINVISIRKVSETRKEVKEVYFYKNKAISKVWVFKADPQETARELAVYHVAYEQGIPTGKPVGYSLRTAQEPYPYDIAILAGILEHAGDSYNQLLDVIQFNPEVIFETATAIARVVAQYHVKLTQAQQEFAKYEVEIPQADPAREIRERFAAGRGMADEEIQGLIASALELQRKLSGITVISQGDLHTGQITTKKTNEYEIKTNEFGIIDWGSITFDNPYGDIQSFWLHHKRRADAISLLPYDRTFADFAAVYEQEFTRLAGEPLRATPTDALIQSALWNLYEMYDPVRTDPEDIRQKAELHRTRLQRDLIALEASGLEEAGKLWYELRLTRQC